MRLHRILFEIGKTFTETFQILKEAEQRKRNKTIEETEGNSLQDLHAILQNASQNWGRGGHWKRHIDSRAEYFASLTINTLKRILGFFFDRPHTTIFNRLQF
jgi:hypothetical protein